MKWCITDSNSIVTFCGDCGDYATHEDFAHLVRPDCTLHLDCPDVSPGCRFDGEFVISRPQKPSDLHDFDDGSFCWQLRPTYMQEAKAAAKLRVNGWRDAAECNGFAAYGKTLDSDDKSIQRLLGAAQAAAIAKQLGKPLSIEWTCADNTTLIMDADMLIEIPVILAQTADALHQKARTLKAQIDAATTLNEIAAIVW